MTKTLSRCLVVAAACLALQSAPSPSRAQDGVASDPGATNVAYYRLISRIIHTRMKNRWYRTLSGGVATIAFTLERDGTVSTVALVKPSGSPLIDALAQAAVPVGYVFPPLPPNPNIRTLRIQVPLRFSASP